MAMKGSVCQELTFEDCVGFFLDLWGRAVFYYDLNELLEAAECML